MANRFKQETSLSDTFEFLAQVHRYVRSSDRDGQPCMADFREVVPLREIVAIEPITLAPVEGPAPLDGEYPLWGLTIRDMQNTGQPLWVVRAEEERLWGVSILATGGLLWEIGRRASGFITAKAAPEARGGS